MKKLLIFFLLFLTVGTCFCEARNALLIANGNYLYDRKLDGPITEIRALKNVLQNLGFSVKILENAKKSEIINALNNFSRTLDINGGIGFFLYSGHGVQINGKNYLLPVDIRTVNTNTTVCLDTVFESMTADENIIIFDACRESTKSSTRGLTLVDVQSRPRKLHAITEC